MEGQGGAAGVAGTLSGAQLRHLFRFQVASGSTWWSACGTAKCYRKLLLILLFQQLFVSVPAPPTRANDDLRTARRYYEGKVADNVRDADSWHGLAVVLRRSELHAQAMLAMSRAVEIAPTPERHRELG